MPKLTFQDAGISQEFETGARILICANKMGIKVSQVCGGDGACGTCRIEVVEGWSQLSPPTPDETYKELEEPYRLSCQTQLLGDAIVKVAKIE